MDILLEIIKNHPEQVNAFAAVCALFVSFLSIVLTVITLWMQRTHNFKSLTPIASIPINDYENQLAIKVKNTGVGPMIVERFSASDGQEEKDDVISWMPQSPPGIYWATFYDSLDGLCIPPNEEAVIIKLVGDSEDKRFTDFRDQVRRALSRLKVRITYKDIYDRRMPAKERDLAWFGRHFTQRVEMIKKLDADN